MFPYFKKCLIFCFLTYIQCCLCFSYYDTHQDDLGFGATFEEKQFLRTMEEKLVKPKYRTANKIDISKYNKTYQSCVTPKGLRGNCKIVQLCEWNELKRNPSNYLDHACIIEGSVVGVCCPNNIQNRRTPRQSSGRPTSTLNIPQAPECGINGKSVTRIRASQESNPKDWPWMAVLLRKIDYYNFCGAVLLNRRYVLTTAHCIFRKTVNDFYVRLGEYDFRTPNETDYVDFNVTQMRMHPDYDPATSRHDIALIKLSRPVRYNAFVRPVCLPNNQPNTNTTVIVAGWGTLFYGGPVSDVLMEVPVPVWDINQCALKYSQPIFNTNLCAAGYEGGKDSCQGDSGGPLLMQSNGRWIVIGVVSWGISCGEIDQPGVYTRVEPYMNWIAINIQDASP